MSKARPNGFSLTQIILHWLVVVLIILQYLANGPMTEAWDALRDGNQPAAELLFGANMHAASGITILVLALLRLALRFTRGVPALPSALSPPMAFVAKATHFLLYALIILIPVSGAAAWLGGAAPAAGPHGAMAQVLFFVAIFHAAAALYEHFIAKTDVLTRMLKPQAR